MAGERERGEKWSGRTADDGGERGEYGSRLLGYNSLESLTCDFVSVFEASRGVVRLRCQGDDSVAYVDDTGRKVEFNDKEETSISPDLNDSGEEAGDGEVKDFG
ncbi:hypothetical protein Vadar_022475 [Vaccinium darrowii]|uniref:Uncharacterized protein n=1 Tax=Vaccinium darrowii TaxID=229202 RepID=A0ACB7ZDY9_9ERIC|nr:hypothetical protein Vadar_022475 [Vaccinium darrowii]